MGLSDCLVKLKDEFGDTFSEKELRGMLEQMQNMQDDGIRSGRLKLIEEMNNRREAFAKERQRMSMDVQYTQQNLNMIQRAIKFGQDPVAALRGLFMGDNTGQKGAGRSILYTRNAYKTVWGQYVEKLQEQGLWEAFNDPKQKSDIYREAYELEKGNAITPNKPGDGVYGPDVERGQPGVTNNQSALKIAQIMNDVHGNIRAAAQHAGYPMGYIEGYFRQRWSPERLSWDVKTPEERAAAKENFVREMVSRTNHEKMFDISHSGLDDMTSQERQQELKTRYLEKAHKFFDTMHDKIIDRAWDKDGHPSGTSDKFITTFEKGVGKKLGQSRSVIFNTPEDAAFMDDQYGHGSLHSKMEATIWGESQRLANISTLGSTPKDSMNALINRTKSLYKDDPSMAEKIESHRKDIMSEFDLASGNNERIIDNWMSKSVNAAKWLQNFKVIQVAFKKTTEWGQTAALLAKSEGTGALGIGENMAKTFSYWMKLAVNGNEKKELAQKLGIDMFEHHIQQTNLEPYGIGYQGQAFTGIDKVDQAMTKLGETSSRMNMLRPMTNLNKVVSGVGLSQMHAGYAEKAFSELSQHMQGQLQRYDIGPAEWDLIRRAKDKTESGREIINTQKIAATSTDDALKTLAEHGIIDGTTPEKLIADTRNKYINYVQDISDRAVYQANLATLSAIRNPLLARSWGMNQISPNSAGAHLISVMNQFKSVLYMMGQNVSFLTHDIPQENTQFFDKLKAGAGNTANYVAPMIAANTVISAAMMGVKAEINGKGMPDYKDPKFWGEALATAGFGLWGEVMFGGRGVTSGKGDTESLSQTILGPTLGNAVPAAHSIFDVSRGNTTAARDRMVNTAEQNVPFINTPSLGYAKKSMDTLIFNHLHSQRWNQRQEMKDLKEEIKKKRGG